MEDQTLRIRVLFVDDEERILRALRALFRDADVFTTANPREAPKLAKEHDVDVVVCDQRMPEVLGVDVLREIRQVAPRAIRILLTGYADLKAVLSSVNEGEVYRFVNKPWDNSELRELVHQSGQIARETPALAPEPVPEKEQDQARGEVGILVIADDPLTTQRLREILEPFYRVQFATTIDRALQVLEQFEAGVVICEIELAQGDVTPFVKALKQHHPHLQTIAITDRADAQLAVDLVNEGQVFRLLLKPVRLGSCRLAVDAAISQYWKLKRNPSALRRFTAAPAAGEKTSAAGALSESLLARIRQLPARIAGMTRFD